jgi:hypothetical protein
MKRYEVKFKIDLRDTSNPQWLTEFVNQIRGYDRMFSDESIVPDSTEVTEVPID